MRTATAFLFALAASGPGLAAAVPAEAQTTPQYWDLNVSLAGTNYINAVLSVDPTTNSITGATGTAAKTDFGVNFGANLGPTSILGLAQNNGPYFINPSAFDPSNRFTTTFVDVMFDLGGQTSGVVPYTSRLSISPLYAEVYQVCQGNSTTNCPFSTLYGFTVSFAKETAVAAVPELATWAMMVGGFGLVGSALRRRPRQQSWVGFAA